MCTSRRTDVGMPNITGPSGGVFFVAAKPSKTVVENEKRARTQLDVTSRVERAPSTSVQAGFGVPGSSAKHTLDGDEPSVHIRIPTGPVTPSAVERKLHKTSGHALHRRCCRWCAAVRTADAPHLREHQAVTDEAASRIDFDPAELEREDQTLSTSSLNTFDDGSESSTATLCSTNALSEHLAETTLAFVEVLRHNVATVRPRTCLFCSC